jgi:hypothetical protein
MEAIFVREFQMVGGAEEAARFVHHACRPATPSADSAVSGEPADREELFYTRVVEHALGYFGSRLLYPARPAVRDLDLGALSAQPQEAVEEQTLFIGARFAFATERLGYMLGSELYDAYLAGRLSKRYIRSLFFRRLNGSTARSTYLQTVRKARAPRRRV